MTARTSGAVFLGDGKGVAGEAAVVLVPKQRRTTWEGKLCHI